MTITAELLVTVDGRVLAAERVTVDPATTPRPWMAVHAAVIEVVTEAARRAEREMT